MTEEELEIMREGVKEPWKIPREPLDIWRKAFDLYAEQTGRKLSTSCAPCYGKVLKHFQNK